MANQVAFEILLSSVSQVVKGINCSQKYYLNLTHYKNNLSKTFLKL